MKDIMFGFVLGAATGGAGGYLAAKYTDRRREQECAHKENRKFQETAALMPEIMEVLRSLLSHPGTSFIREIVVLANSRVVFTPSKKCCLLLEERYKDLSGKIFILENSGYIVRISKDGAEIYRMTEDFVKMVLSIK